MFSTTRADYGKDWLGSTAATWLDRIGDSTPMCGPGVDDVALQFVRSIRAIRPEDYLSLYALVSTQKPTEASLRRVLSYIDGTPTTLSILWIFEHVDGPYTRRQKNQVADNLFSLLFHTMFISGTPNTVLLRVFLSMARHQDPSFFHQAARASIGCVQTMQVLLQSNRVDPNYGDSPADSLLVLACMGAHHTVVGLLVTRSHREIIMAALRVAEQLRQETIVSTLLTQLREEPN